MVPSRSFRFIDTIPHHLLGLLNGSGTPFISEQRQRHLLRPLPPSSPAIPSPPNCAPSLTIVASTLWQAPSRAFFPPDRAFLVSSVVPSCVGLLLIVPALALIAPPRSWYLPLHQQGRLFPFLQSSSLPSLFDGRAFLFCLPVVPSSSISQSCLPSLLHRSHLPLN